MNGVNSGDLLAGRYRIIDRITTDLLHVDVWTAQDQILDRPVRLSVVGGDHRTDALDSARRAALVQDPRLPRVLDVGAADGVSYVVTEPATGQTLSEIVAAGIVDPQQAQAIVGEAAAALEQARERGVHHLAIRPGSILVDGSKVLVTGLGVDAGVAGLDQRDPETTSRADVQCLVATLYYLMTARWPGPSLDVAWIDPQAIHPLPARRQDGAVVSLAQIRGDVPPSLVALCDQTFTGHDGDGSRWDKPTDAGPATSGGLVEQLRPWGEVSVVAALPEFVRPEPGAGVNRQSVRTAFGSSTVPPGTPPPAPPVRQAGRIHRVVGAASAAGVAGEAATTGVQTAEAAPGSLTRTPTGVAPAGQTPTTIVGGGPAVSPAPEPNGPAPVTTTSGHVAAPAREAVPSGPPDSGITTPGRPVLPGPHPAPHAPGGGRRGRFNPTAIMLLLAVVAVVGGIVWAVGNAFQGFSPPIENHDQSTEQPVESPGADGTDAEAPPADAGPPVIASGEALDPEGAAAGDSAGEHPETAANAVDGNPSSVWTTRTYKSARFGNLKSGVGYALTLENPATVSGITLTTANTGGHVEVRATTADQPTGGEVLASGPLAATTELTFAAPVEGQSFVLWFSELPQAGDGGYRVEISEIVVH